MCNNNPILFGDIAFKVTLPCDVKEVRFLKGVNCGDILVGPELYATYENNIFTIKSENPISAGTSCYSMFKEHELLENVDLSNLDTSSVHDMTDMFYGCKSLKAVDFSMLDTTNVESVSHMFWGCKNLHDLNLDGFSDKEIIDMDCMFFGCEVLESIDLSSFTFDKARTTNGMFSKCLNLKEVIPNYLNTNKVYYMREMFAYCPRLNDIKVNMGSVKAAENFRVGYHVPAPNPGAMLLPGKQLNRIIPKNCKKIEFLWGKNEGNILVSDSTSDYLIYATYENDVFTVKSERTLYAHYDANCYFMFMDNVEEFVFDNFNTLLSESFWDMFKGCAAVKTLDLANWDVSNVSEMESMFEGCKHLITMNVENWETHNVRTFSKMFKGCEALESLDLSNWTCCGAESAKCMFYGCRRLKHLNMPSCLTKDRLVLSSIFKNCNRLKCPQVESLDCGMKYYMFNG